MSVKPKPHVASFYILDSPKEGYFSIMLRDTYIGFFMRKAGMYGMLAEKGMCVAVGNAKDEWRVVQVHIVEDYDVAPTYQQLLESIAKSVGITSHDREPRTVPEFEVDEDWQTVDHI